MEHHEQENPDATEQWLNSLSQTDDDEVELPASLLDDIFTYVDTYDTLPSTSIEQLVATLHNPEAAWQTRAKAIKNLGTFGVQAPLDELILSLKNDQHEA